MIYPDFIMRDLRQNLDCETDDESQDERIDNMSHNEALDRICNWNGLINYGEAIRAWVQAIYGVVLK